MAREHIPLLVALLAACPSDDLPPASSSTTGTTESSTSGTDSGTTLDPTDTGTTTTGGDEPLDCTIEPGNHDAICDDGSCGIVTDVVLDCGGELSNEGLRVAPGPEGAVLVTVGRDHPVVLRAEGDQGQVSELSSVAWSWQTFATQTPDGTVQLLASTGAGSIFALVLDGGSSPELVCDDCADVYDFESDLEGTLHAWYGFDETHAQRIGPDDWSLEPAPPTQPGAFAHYVPLADGRWAAFSYADTGGLVRQLWRRIEGVDVPFGSPKPNDNLHSWTYVTAELPMPMPLAEAPDHAVVEALPSGMTVTWSDGAMGWQEAPVPGTQGVVESCLPGEPVGEGGAGCNEDPCHETSTGFAGRAHDVARTADGTLWLVWVEDRNDYTIVHTEDCDDEGGCSCRPERSDEQSTGLLHVQRFDFVNPPQEVLTLALEPIATHGQNVWYTERSVDTRAFGDRLAIGLRLRREPADIFSAPKLRLIELDTTMLD